MVSSLRSGLWFFTVILLVSAQLRGDEPPKALTVCAIPASMPRMGKAPDGTPGGLDIAVALRLGQRLGRPIAFHWCASPSCAWNCLPAGRCDVVLGQPQGSGPARDVAWSVPYAGAQFGLVVPRGAVPVRSLADLRGKRVGIVTGTAALAESDHVVARFASRETLLDGFAAAALDAAFLDADFAAWYLHDHPQLDLRLVSEHVPREHWNMALAVRSGDGPLLVAINRTLAELAESGELREIYKSYGVPYREPFTFNEAPRTRGQDAPNTWRRVRERGELVVSMDPANLPYSSARDERPGLDVELARALARQLEVRLRIEWLDVQHETAVGELLEHACDLVLGEAIDPAAVADDEPLAGKILYSRPYYGTGYVLVRRKDGPRIATLADVQGTAAQRLGTEAGSIADYRLRQRGHLRRLFRNQLATLKALSDGDIDHAYLWGNVGWTLHVSPDFDARLELVPGYVPEDHWNIAIAMNAGDVELKQHVDAALAALLADSAVARSLGRYHVAAFPPFAEPEVQPARKPEPGNDGRAKDSADNGPTIHHAVADRGREPQMQRIQGSKAPYSGLARVRSAGELVVGLDPNNLPFSTAHPRPAGLDHELAGVLAAELGVSLRVFWGLSSHDSYPSQLATRRHCDVILGVMPDDRFVGRVLYSRPYYMASYQRVVRASGDPPGAEDPLAVEQGVAVRGLKGHRLQAYPSTEAVLEAIVLGRAKEGYVISTRGPWLAQQRWPGVLGFLPAEAGSVDRFPVCAAVRKTDRDLKEAIDQAWDALGRSGRLGKVFAHWQIPYESATLTDGPTEKAP